MTTTAGEAESRGTAPTKPPLAAVRSDPSAANRAADQPPRRGPGVDLQEQTETYWQSRSPEERQAYLAQLDENYQAIIKQLLELQSLSVDQFKDVANRHKVSRRRMIWLTGFLAIANILVSAVAAQAENKALGSWLTLVKVTAVVLPVLVAAYAAVLAIFSNLESLESYLQRAQLYRHAREMTLNACRELEMLWHLYVRPFSDTPIACVNAANLYRHAVTKDQEVRSQLMEKPEAPKH